jgi:hypothetical protein
MVCDTRHSSHGDSRMLVLLTMCRALYLQVLNSPACTFSRLYLPRRDDLSPSSPFLFLRESGSIPPAPSSPRRSVIAPAATGHGLRGTTLRASCGVRPELKHNRSTIFVSTELYPLLPSPCSSVPAHRSRLLPPKFARKRRTSMVVRSRRAREPEANAGHTIEGYEQLYVVETFSTL